MVKKTRKQRKSKIFGTQKSQSDFSRFVKFSRKSQVKLLMWLIMATLSFVIILGLWKIAFSKVPDKASEDACFIFNAVRTKAKLEIAGKEIIGVPRACKKIEKIGDKSIPEDTYAQNAEGAKEQLSNMIAKCWWMWLEGRDPNIMEIEFFSGKNKCFICYQFGVDKDISFSAAEFDTELFKKTYKAEDSSDKCAGALGGKCVNKDECINDYKEAGKCQDKDKVCCIHKKNVCENKGGTCNTKPCDSDNEPLYPKWKCETGKSCCIKKDNQLTYYEYVQVSGGPGRIIIDKNNIQNFDDKGVYAVTFAKQDTFIELKLKDLDPSASLRKDISTIFISKLSDVDKLCVVELGVEAGVNG